MLTEHPTGSPSPTRGTTTDVQDNFRAGSVRIVLAVFSAVALPFLLPGAKGYLGVIFAYLAVTILFQVAIVKDWGGVYRVLLGGMADIAFLTFIVHRMGTMSTPFVAAYSLVGMFNALVVPAWAAISLALLGIGAYTVTCFGEALHLLPYAPDFPEYAGFTPDLEAAARSVAMLATLVAVSTWVSHRIALALRQRQRALLEANVRLEQLSQRDPLTQLYNRRYFMQRTDEELARVRRGHPMAVLMMDLDGFKQVNDAYGHLTGDDLLRKIAETIEGSTRAVDVVGRFGGDEFVAMLTDTDAEQALVVADRLVATIQKAGAELTPSRPVTASVGIALAAPDHDVTSLLNVADDAAYRAKQAGGNRYYLTPERPISGRVIESGPRAAKVG